MAFLCLVRHGQSQWNAASKWTGLTDIPLSEEGKRQSEAAALRLKNFLFDYAYTSVLTRSIETLEIIKKLLDQTDLPAVKNSALNERDYGDFTGKNKWDLEKQFGKEVFHQIRRGWNYPIAHGETLKDVYNRVIPYYESEILQKLKENKNILIVAHGNSLRALVKYLEQIKDTDIDKLNIETGQVYLYNIDNLGKIISKEIL